MRKIFRPLAVAFCQALLIASINFHAQAQGCSDAGFCTVGDLAHGSSHEEKYKLTFATPMGRGDGGVLVVTPGVQLDMSLSERTSLQARVTGNFASGTLASVGGLGDVFLSGSFRAPLGSSFGFSGTLGVKLPLSDGGLSVSDGPLPMQYQSSLGTVDAVVGTTLTYSGWGLSLGLQVPLTGENNNGFLPSLWTSPDALSYPPTNQFNRQSDLLVRLSRELALGGMSLNLGALYLYHLADDTYRDPSISPDPITLVGSQGSTLNVTLRAIWMLGSNVELGFAAAMPLVIRDIRPDGLTRSWVFAPEISWRF